MLGVAASEVARSRAERGHTGIQGLLQDAGGAEDAPPRPRSRRPTGSWRASFTPTATPATRPPRRRFKEINEANEVLADPKKRQQYDMLGSNWEQFARPAGRARRPRVSAAATRSGRAGPSPASAGRPGRQRPLRVPHGRRRRTSRTSSTRSSAACGGRPAASPARRGRAENPADGRRPPSGQSARGPALPAPVRSGRSRRGRLRRQTAGSGAAAAANPARPRTSRPRWTSPSRRPSTARRASSRSATAASR